MSPFTRATAGATAVALCLALAIVGVGSPAVADTQPADPSEPTTVSADALPTAQIDGVVWDQVVVGNTVYVAGSFATARPAGSAPGVDTVPRANLLAYDLATGALVQSFAPTTNAQVLSIAASPDGSRLYIGGDFTQVNGASVWRIAAINRTTGALLTTFLPKPDAKVRAITVTADTVYFGGLFNAVGAATRPRLAAARVSDGGLLDWAPAADGAGGVNAMALSPDGTSLVVGGSFTTLNGSSNPGYGLGAVDATTGSLLPFAANTTWIRNGTDNGAITDLTGDADYVYGSGYTYGRTGGTLEGTFAARWDGGAIEWIEDCHGDTYSAFPMGGVVYQASHKHYCGNIGSYPQVEPWVEQHATALTKAATGIITREPYSYTNFEGNPRPTQVNWYPQMTTGSYTGQDQSAFDVTGNSQYVVMGGEFPTVNGTPQQGLVRFAVSSIAPDAMGPVNTGGRFDLSGASLSAGEIRLRWTANYDWDNTELTYQLIRNSNTASPVYQTVQSSRFYDRPYMGYVDTGLVPGTSYRYRLRAIDPWGNIAWSDSIDVVAASADAPTSSYAATVLADDPSLYWRMGEAGGAQLIDSSDGWSDAFIRGALTRGATGAVRADADGATTFSGASTDFATTTTSRLAPASFTIEAWFRTTSGGRVLGFGTSDRDPSRYTDRQVYLSNAGRLYFGVRPYGIARETISSTTSFTDGQWHHVVAVSDPTGMYLYADGLQVATKPGATLGFPSPGYWRVGGDALTGWTQRPTNDYFSGDIDEVAVYENALSPAQVARHYEVGTAEAPVNLPPVARFTLTPEGLGITVDGASSSDSDGSVVSYAWSFGDGATATGVTAARTFAVAGTYAVTLTVTDDDGATGSRAQSVTVPVEVGLPTVLSTAPVSGATGVVTSSSVVAVLSAVPGSGTPVLAVSTSAGAVGGSSSFDVPSRTVRFTPNAALPAGVVVSAEVSVGGTALSGGSWSFATAPAPPTSAIQRYITRVYLDLFGRAPDPAGLATWTAALSSGTPRVAVANGITGSREYRSGLIREAYQRYLGRAAEPAGLASWLVQMDRGRTITDMEAGFVASDEYYRKAGGTDSAWVSKLYADVLGRTASAAEVQSWVAQVGVKGRFSIARGFLLSSEHLTTVVNGYYQELLGRSIDPTGRATWVAQLQRGVRLEAVIGSIIASDEYFNKA